MAHPKRLRCSYSYIFIDLIMVNMYLKDNFNYKVKFSVQTCLLFQSAFTCSKSTKETLEQAVKYVQS